MENINENDWNITDGYKPEERLYVKPAPHAVRALYLTSAITIPASQLQEAYVLDEEVENGYTAVRLPNFNNVRVRVRNTDIVFHTFESNETYTSRLEIGTPFRYKDSSSISAEDIVPAAPEWLNNLCNRIDSLEAKVETLEEYTEDITPAVENVLEDYDFDYKVREAIDDFDLGEKVQDAIDEIDHQEMVRDVIARYDFKNIVMSIIESPEFVHMIQNTLRQQAIRFVNSEKTLKEIWDGNLPLYYRDKGWR
jgi:hypothetical protein